MRTFRTGTLSARDRAYAWIKEAILRRNVAPGEFLIETELSKMLGVSRTPIREALQALEAEGLIRLIPRKGALVTDISLQDLEEVFELRIMIEQFALEKLIRTRNFSCLERMKEKLELQRLFAEENKPVEFIAVDREFHLCYIKATDNHRVYRFYDGLRDELMRLGIEAIQTPGRMAEVLDEHQAIVDSFDRGLLHEAREAVTKHLVQTKIAIARAMSYLK